MTECQGFKEHMRVVVTLDPMKQNQRAILGY